MVDEVTVKLHKSKQKNRNSDPTWRASRSMSLASFFFHDDSKLINLLSDIFDQVLIYSDMKVFFQATDLILLLTSPPGK